MSCHSEFVSNVFSRLDYAGISVLICGSSITWLYFGFYCEFYHRLTYMITIAVLGLLTIVLTLMDKFNRPVSAYDIIVINWRDNCSNSSFLLPLCAALDLDLLLLIHCRSTERLEHPRL